MRDASYQTISNSNLFSGMEKSSIFPVPLEELIFGVSFLSSFGVLQLPNEKIAGNRVPTVIFKDEPSFFHAFLFALYLAYSVALLTISLREGHPKVARHCRYLAVASMATAVGILVASLLCPLFTT